MFKRKRRFYNFYLPFFLVLAVGLIIGVFINYRVEILARLAQALQPAPVVATQLPTIGPTLGPTATEFGAAKPATATISQQATATVAQGQTCMSEPDILATLGAGFYIPAQNKFIPGGKITLQGQSLCFNSSDLALLPSGELVRVPLQWGWKIFGGTLRPGDEFFQRYQGTQKIEFHIEKFKIESQREGGIIRYYVPVDFLQVLYKNKGE